MGETTGISWTDSTFNPWIGCMRVSPGCVNCYAEALDKRMGGGIDPSDGEKKLRWGVKAPRTRTSVANWRKPVQWNAAAVKLGKRHRVFCSSLADVFEDRAELVPWRADLFRLIDSTPSLDWQLLTKRPENIARLMPKLVGGAQFTRPNVWLGTTVEDQIRANDRIAHLVLVPAVVHFLSVEPQLEHITFYPPLLDHVEWVVVGGESGGKARPFHIEWARYIARQCDHFGAAFFMKQVGDNPVPAISAGHHGADIKRFPPDLQRQEFPRAA